MNIFDKLKLPFAKKVKQVPVSWVEEGPEHYYVIHHLLFGYSDSTSVFISLLQNSAAATLPL